MKVWIKCRGYGTDFDINDSMNIMWIELEKKCPKQTCQLRDFIFIVSDGEKLGLARWADLCADDPDCGSDQDEFDFKLITSPFFIIKYWYGPVLGPNFMNYIDLHNERGSNELD